MRMPKILQNLFRKSNEQINEVRDPICVMKVDLEKTQFKSTYQGKLYGFCSAHCKAEFDKNPYQYADANF